MIARIPAASSGAPTAASVDYGDRTRYSAYGRPTLQARGDADHSGVADFNDYNTILGAWNKAIGDPDYAAAIDLDHSGVIDFNDMSILLAVWGSTEAPGTSAPATRPCSIAYTGALWDPVAQMSLMRNRWQDPILGRFITRDPAGYVDGMSLYLYSRGNPLGWWDPWGLEACGVMDYVRGMGMELGRMGRSLWDSATTDPITGEQSALIDPIRGQANFLLNAAKGTAEEIVSRAKAVDEDGQVGALDLLAAGGQVLTGMDKLGNAIAGHDPVANKPLEGAERWAEGFQGGASGALLVLGPAASMQRAGTVTVEAATSGSRTGTTLARELGEAGERAAGTLGPKKRVPVPGTSRYRLPDKLTPTALTESKNVKSLAFTSQLRDYVAISQARGIAFDLHVRQSTTLSGPLKQAIERGHITIHRTIPEP